MPAVTSPPSVVSLLGVKGLVTHGQASVTVQPGATEALSPITHPAPPTSRLESRRLAPGRQPPPPHCTEERDYGDLSPRVKDRVG